MEAVNMDFFGSDPKVTKAVQFALNVAVTKAPILIVGEVGTGKRTLGELIHQKSNRTAGPVCIVDCAEDPKTVENNILGFREEESGRFQKGVLERASGGTVIFANIDSLDEAFQKRLHQILQELDDYELDVRIVSTTTKNLSKLVGAGRFYRGLYTLVSGTQITLPPLRERTQDIENLAKRIMLQLNTQAEAQVGLSEAALSKLCEHYWTHNISELRSVIEGSYENNSDEMVDVDDLAIGEKRTVSMIVDSEDDGIKLMSLKEAERLLIKKALIHTSENRTQAAKILGVSIRTLRNKINEYRQDGNQFFINLR